MFRKIYILFLVSLTSLFSAGTPVSFAETAAELNQARKNIYALIDAGKVNEARLAKDKLLADFNNNPNLPEAIYWIAERYERMSNFEEAKSNFQQITQKHPSSTFANKARLGIARAESMSLIMSEKYHQAKGAIDKMVADFGGNPDLPEHLFWITERYVRLNRFEEAKQNYQRIIQKFPSNRFANKAKLWLSRINATALIESGGFAQAQREIDKLAADFAGDTDLPMVLYWTVEKLERMDRFEEAKQNYQRIVQNYPGNSLVDKARQNVSWADRANLGIARANVMSLIVSGNYDGAKAAIDKMIIEFAGNPTLPAALYWITERYEWADKLDEAKSVYEQIIRNHPGSPYASRAKLGIRRVDVMALMNSADGKAAEESLNKMIEDFRDNPELPRAVFIIGAKCFLDAKAPDYSQRAIKTVERVIEELPKTEAMTGVYEEVYCCAGDCCFDMNDNIKALSYYKKLAGESPEHRLSAKAQFRIGEVYQKLEESGLMATSEAQTQKRLAYEQLLLRYPNSEYADSAKSWLNQHKPGSGGQK